MREPVVYRQLFWANLGIEIRVTKIVHFINYFYLMNDKPPPKRRVFLTKHKTTKKSPNVYRLNRIFVNTNLIQKGRSPSSIARSDKCIKSLRAVSGSPALGWHFYRLRMSGTALHPKCSGRVLTTKLHIGSSWGQVQTQKQSVKTRSLCCIVSPRKRWYSH
jgi:hypothetical protein